MSSLNIPLIISTDRICRQVGTERVIILIFQVFPWLYLWDIFMDETTVSFIKNTFLFSTLTKILRFQLLINFFNVRCLLKKFQLIFKLEHFTHAQVHCGTKTRQSWSRFDMLIITMCSQRSIHFCWNEDSLLRMYNTVLTLDVYILLQYNVVT